MYPRGCVPPKFYGLPKIHKPDTPLRPIVSSCGSVTYGVAKELAEILKPLVGKLPHHITSNQDFVEQTKQIKLEPGECLSSYDVSALFTSVPIEPALNIIKDLLDKDTTLKERTLMEPHCGQSHHGELRTKALSTAPTLPSSGTGMWMTPLSSTRKPTNKASFNTSAVLTLL